MSDDDPFDSFDVPEDRDGDPFEELDDIDAPDTAEDAEPTQEPDDGGPPETDADSDAEDEPTFEEAFIDEGDIVPTDTDATSSPSPADDEDGAALGDEDPFIEMDGREGDPFESGESGFESVDIDGIDSDDLWESLEEESTTSTADGSRYAEVSKHHFCEQCEHFSRPPTAHCTHEEAEIVEYLDMETVRLLNCPVVAEQRELENEE